MDGDPPVGRDGVIAYLRKNVFNSTAAVTVISGPNSCGKTRAILCALEGRTCAYLDFRSVGLMSEDNFIDSMKTELQFGSEVGRRSLTEWPTTSRSLRAVLRDLGDILRCLAKEGTKPVIVFDEINALTANKNPATWKYEAMEFLQHYFIRLTKVTHQFPVVLVSSNDVWSAQLHGKENFEVMSLGYVTKHAVIEYLQRGVGPGTAVAEEELREWAWEEVGGYFPLLQKVRELRARFDSPVLSPEEIAEIQSSVIERMDDDILEKQCLSRYGWVVSTLARRLYREGGVYWSDAQRMAAAAMLGNHDAASEAIECLCEENIFHRRFPVDTVIDRKVQRTNLSLGKTSQVTVRVSVSGNHSRLEGYGDNHVQTCTRNVGLVVV